jgi:hypothetical protein
MKRIAWILLLSLLLLFVACNQGEDESTDNATDTAGQEKTEQRGWFEREPEPEQTEQPEVTEDTRQQERDKLEAQRKEEYGEFYVPLPGIDADITVSTVTAKGVFVTSPIAAYNFSEENIDWYAAQVEAGNNDYGDTNALERILGLIKATELNTMVVDVKTDDGFVTLDTDLEIIQRVDSDYPQSEDNYQALMQYAEANDIHMIARVVSFKDHHFAETQTDHSIQLTDGGVWRDGAGSAWVNPFDDFVWKYVVAIAKEAALAGFDEIQFDYVRFPDGAASYNPITHFPGREDRRKDDGIDDFLQYAVEELKPYGVAVSADVFGIITHTWDDSPEDIGQTWRKISDKVDVISPMIYPSHYSTGWYQYDYPDQHPYGVLYASMQEAIERNAAIDNPAAIRPWIQGFTAPWVDGYMDYTPTAISDQIVACRELGIEEYLIWATNNTYDPGIFRYEDRIDPNVRAANQDLLDQTPADALERFLNAQYHERTVSQYLMTLRSERPRKYEDFLTEWEERGTTLNDYTIPEEQSQGEGETVTLQAHVIYENAEGIADVPDASFEIVQEDGVWKVRMPDLTFETPATEEETEETDEEDTEDTEDTEAEE